MIITAYFDESGTHKDAPLAVMAGYLGDEQQWQEFNVRVGELFSECGVRQFHLVDLRHSDRDFAGWSIDKKIHLTDELQHIANEPLEIGVTTFLRDETYQKHYCSLDWPRKAQRDSNIASCSEPVWGSHWIGRYIRRGGRLSSQRCESCWKTAART